MINHFPPWVEAGGFFLTLISGAINVIGLLGFHHQAISHLTGISSLIGYELAHGNWSVVLHLSLIALSFVLGAALSGAIIHNEQLRLGRPYGVTLLVEASFLIIALIILNLGSTTGHFFAAAACGLQNAMTTTYSGALIRTTHVSGLFTDLGIMLGNWLRGTPTHMRKVTLYLVLISGFIIGGILGAWAFQQWALNALLLPACSTALLAAAYWLFLHRKHT